MAGLPFDQPHHRHPPLHHHPGIECDVNWTSSSSCSSSPSKGGYLISFHFVTLLDLPLLLLLNCPIIRELNNYVTGVYWHSSSILENVVCLFADAMLRDPRITIELRGGRSIRRDSHLNANNYIISTLFAVFLV